MQKIDIVDYRSDWQQEYSRIARKLRGSGAANVVRIDHIGSTSVAGLAAKDIIDIQVSVADLSGTDHVQVFENCGFRLKPSINSDVLTGVDDHSPQLRKQYFREPEGERRTHIHVREVGRLNQRYALLFRDYLRADPIVRSAYEVIKRRLAEIYPDDIDGYLSIKDPVMDSIYAGAEHWANAEGWEPSKEHD